MYRRLGENGGESLVDPWGSGPLVEDPAPPWVPPPGEVIYPGPSPSPSPGGPAISWNIGDSIARIISGITGGGSVHATVPGAQGFPGSSGCPFNQCPTQAGPVVICQPCAGGPVAGVATTVSGITGSPWFWPVTILAVVLVATSGRRR
mgnify:CR=1 FL=1